MSKVADMCHRMQILAFFVVFWTGGLCFTCLDYNSNSVDWYAAYKTPKIAQSSDWKIQEGLAHFYLDVHSPVWQLSDRTINESQQAVYETLSAGIYNNQKKDSMFLLYNDESPPDSASNERGHTKGVVAFDTTSGFWLIHSVPHFPYSKSEGYVWPHSALTYGQSFLCVSFPYKELGNIAKQLLYNEPSVYESYVSQSILDNFPDLNDVIHGGSPQGPPWSSVIKLTSLDGQEFTSFAKSGDFGEDLYASLVAPSLRQDLQVETWENGKGGKLNSSCSTDYKVVKITKVSLPAEDVVFNETKDHSKWAVSFSPDTRRRGKYLSRFSILENWTCVGDINRMESQFKRGGGTLCLQNSSVWEAYKNTVADYLKCPSAI